MKGQQTAEVHYNALTHLSEHDPLTTSHLLYGGKVTSPVYPDDRETKEDDVSSESAEKLYR
ncbi:hypothetical protein DPMN_076093 [Dreissena polymorpha]|uniref:Uncharacterized protein n=1 Tax=Dreissena polymorpha TaxID=45954 RepID=A0A9D3YLS0_DREPO|nr:hypothetical protein DPMN_076093 [Dreissena polymorpha]